MCLLVLPSSQRQVQGSGWTAAEVAALRAGIELWRGQGGDAQHAWKEISRAVGTGRTWSACRQKAYKLGLDIADESAGEEDYDADERGTSPANGISNP